MGTYTIGLDFGTESARALLLNYGDGSEVALREHRYENGVARSRLPVDGDEVPLPPDWALQDPEDYVRALYRMIPGLLRDVDISAHEVVGIGVDFTSCTMLPVTRDGRPLCTLPAFRRNPHAWVKLWSHHAAHSQAKRIEAEARMSQPGWLDRYGDSVSSEWLFPKILQTIEEAPDVFEATGYFLEAADWIIWKLTGEFQMSACTAGYKAFWSEEEGFPGPGFFGDLDLRLSNAAERKMPPVVRPVGSRAGCLTEEAALHLDLLEGTPVATALIDAHASVPGAAVTESGRMVLIMGTSLCQMVLDEKQHPVRGVAGVVENGIVPGLFAYEAGQPSLGDSFAWAADLLGGGITTDAGRFERLESQAAALEPGQSGLLALDWLNGNRSILDDSELSGLLVGITLGTTAADVYRAIMESCAFGTRVIIDRYQDHGVAVEELVACGGLAHRSELFLQILADVCNRPIRVAASRQASALGAALFGAVAAGSERGGAATIVEAVDRAAHLDEREWRPDERNARVYARLYEEYREIHDHFGQNTKIMRRLREIRDRERFGE